MNLDKLPDDAKAVLAWAFEHLISDVFPVRPYMIECAIDDPLRSLLEGESMNVHYGNGSRCYQKYHDDKHAVIHIEDEDWQQYQSPEWVDRGREVLRKYLPGIDDWEQNNTPAPGRLGASIDPMWE